jgi:germination protein M
LIPVTRRVAKQEGIAKAAINGLIDSSINREELEYYGLYPVLTEGTEIRGLKIKDGNATIDFNSKLLEYSDKTAEKNIFSSIVYTLTEFKTVKNVKILIDGAEKSRMKYGTDLSVNLNRTNVLINSSNLALEKGMGKVDIYLLKNTENQYSYTLPVSVEYAENTNGSVPKKIIEYLAKGSKVKELYSLLPQKTRLLDSNIDGKLITLDFNSSIKDYGGGNTKEEGLMKQILYSMKQVEGIEKVKIMIEGKEDSLPEGTDISSEIALPVEINNNIDKN